jgi:hypothetical protein
VKSAESVARTVATLVYIDRLKSSL